MPKNVYPLRLGASFYPLLVSFHLQITYRKVRNLQIGVNKLVGKVLINLLHPMKFIMPHKLISPRSLLRKQTKTKLMLCKPLFIIHVSVKAF